MIAMTRALSALSSPSRATSSAMVTKSAGCTFNESRSYQGPCQGRCRDAADVDTARINSYTRDVSTKAPSPTGRGWRDGKDVGVDRELYFISAASEMLGMHPQT